MELEQRDLVGYGKTPPRIDWPGGARIVVSIVINYEEGSENTPVLGDAIHETAAEMASKRPPEARDLQTESQWEYGARAGAWRLLRILEEHGVNATFFVSALALEFNPSLGPEILAAGHDITGHGYRWIEQWHLDRDAEKEYIQKAIDSFVKTCGIKPLAWNTKTGRSANTREILKELGFLYDSDSINDDLPFYTKVTGKPWLVVPYALDTNDGKYWRQGWSNSSQFFEYLKDSFDVLYEEGTTTPKMLSIGLHSRVSGRPGRAVALRNFLQYIKGHPGVWIAKRDDIARWWLEHYPPGA